eukprot:TRINITY_DN31597_c0_g1_i1.p1 TRINITY_DN31597_c0_g1~~TRINITY_DN31597_c0_g1_i1.p1  ORF type:complete len:1140 (-),score=353.53 TRINITY_DN31597_c0_g1_i1:87-3215(-)
MSLEARFKDIVEAAVDQERREREAAQNKLGSRLNDELTDMRLQVSKFAGAEEMQEFRRSMQERHDELSQAHNGMMQRFQEFSGGLARHSNFHQELERKLGSVRSMADQERGNRDIHHRGLLERLEKLEDELRSQVSRRVMSVEGELLQLRSLLATASGGAQSLALVQSGPSLIQDMREQQDKSDERLKRMEQTVSAGMDKQGRDLDMSNQIHQSRLERLERDLAEARSQLDRRVSSSEDRSTTSLHSSMTSVKERLDVLEKLIGDSVGKTSDELRLSLEGVQMSLTERLSRLEAAQGAVASSNAEDLTAVHTKLGQVAGRLAACEAHGKELRDVRAQLVELSDSKEAVEASQAASKQQLDSFGGQLHGQVKDWEVAQERLARVQSRLAGCEEQLGGGGSMGTLQRTVTGLAEQVAILEAQQSSCSEKLGQVQGLQSQTLSRQGEQQAHQAQLCDQLAHLASTSAEVNERQSAVQFLQDRHSEELQVLKTSRDSISEKLKACEKMLRDQATDHAKDFGAIRNLLNQTVGKVSSCETELSGLADLKRYCAVLALDKDSLASKQEALQHSVEEHAKLSADFSAKSAKDHAALNDSLVHLQNRVARCEQLELRLADLQKQQVASEEEHKSLQTSQTSLMEKLEYVTSLSNSTSERLRADLEAGKAVQSRHSRDLESLRASSAQQAVMLEQLGCSEKKMGEESTKLHDELLALEKKLEQQQSRIQTCEGQAAPLQELKKAQAGAASDKARTSALLDALTERLQFLESDHHSFAQSQSASLHAANDQLDQMQSRVAKCEAQSSAIVELRKFQSALAGERSTQEASLSAIAERTGQLEAQLSGSVGKHAQLLKDLESLKALQSKAEAAGKEQSSDLQALTERCSAFPEALGKVEAKLSQLNSQAQEAFALRTKLEELQSKLAEECTARETNGAFLKDLLSKEKERRDSNQTSLKERLDYLENVLGESAQRHHRELEDARMSQAKSASEAQAREALLEALSERLQRLEASVGEAMQQTSQDRRAIEAKVEQLKEKFADVGSAWSHAAAEH